MVLDLHDRSDELLDEPALEERRPVGVQKVDDEALDVGPVLVLIGHDHHLPVAQRLHVLLRVVLALVLEPEDLDHVVDLGVLENLLVRRLADVEELAAEREDAKEVASDDGEAGDGEGLGRVSLGEDERALHRVLGTGQVGVLELGHALDHRLFLASRLLVQLVLLLELCPQHDRVHYARLERGDSKKKFDLCFLSNHV